MKGACRHRHAMARVTVSLTKHASRVRIAVRFHLFGFGGFSESVDVLDPLQALGHGEVAVSS